MRLALWRRGRAIEHLTSEPAEITIGTTIIAPNPERFGANLEIPDYEPWKLNASLCNTFLADGGLERLALRTWPDGSAPSLRWILVHMIEEYARHNGHADLLRESVDGLTGE